ncbi:hypothetical protein MD484_g1281, partial [Candolleomyces efflorescens]
MTLTQSVLRVPGPSWDEEVVPALRKRLESESRTLSKRMSAISLTGDDVLAAVNQHSSQGTSSRHTPPAHAPIQSYYREVNGGSSSLDYSSSAPGFASSNPNSARKPAANGSPSPSTPNYQRARTYSQPDHALTNGSSKMNRANNASSSSTRTTKPTRIPKPATRTYASHSNGSTPAIPQTNGFAYSPEQQYEPRGGTSTSSHFTTSSTHSRSTVGGISHKNRSNSGLLNESPPFPPSSSTTSLAYSNAPNGYHEPHDEWMEAVPSRQSMDSEEQPFEHWYRGEVSRNGGVGELRVGRRQEMLDIATYGHMIRNRNHNANLNASPRWGQPPSPYSAPREDMAPQQRHRKRAGSIGGITEVERVRGSVYFDEEGIAALGRVLDESPLTDFEDDPTSDVASISSFSRVNHNFLPGVGDISTTSAVTVVSPTQLTNVHEEDIDQVTTPRLDDRSTTPTQQTARDSRSGTPSTMNTIRSTNVSTSSTSKTPSPPLIAPSGNRSVSGSSMSGPGGKKMPAPSTPSGKKRAPVKSLKGKQAPPTIAKKEAPRETAHYPSPGDEEDMAYAIPSWTQPVPRTGNWDEVVLPVVARKKGLDDHYEKADGSPQPRKAVEDPIEPAPGTFGFTRKVRNKQGDEFIPLDEFGQPEPAEKPTEEEPDPQEKQSLEVRGKPPGWPQNAYDMHDQTRLPQRASPPPSPPPFSHYAPKLSNGMAVNAPSTHFPEPPSVKVHEEEGAGCCKCAIM